MMEQRVYWMEAWEVLSLGLGSVRLRIGVIGCVFFLVCGYGLVIGASNLGHWIGIFLTGLGHSWADLELYLRYLLSLY